MQERDGRTGEEISAGYGKCSERYKIKGVMGCSNRHVDESTLEKAFVMAWNAVVENKADFLEKWKEEAKSEDLLLAYRAQDFTRIIGDAQPIEKMETDFMLRVLDHIKVYESGTLVVVFMERTEIELN